MDSMRWLKAVRTAKRLTRKITRAPQNLYLRRRLGSLDDDV
jgi:hypothetical protein